ncbi:MAG: D-2-hydroxyacid dehydrogenase [Clostridiales bacterium]|nr:D-2-hydroxyacid dehydrogenase [Clostridiales bacterium]
MKVLVLGYNRDVDVFLPDGWAHRELERRFPDCEFRVYKRGQETLEDMLWADVVTGHPSRQMLRQAGNIKWLHIQSAGVDGYTDKSIYANPNIIVTRTADVFSFAIAEHTLGMILALNRNFPRYIRNQSMHIWDRGIERYELFDSNVLMLGTGSLASEIVKLLKPFGCRIFGVRRSPEPVEGYDRIYSSDQLHSALAEADYIINTLPRTPRTEKYLGADEFAVMKDRAILINVGRGATVDTGALIEALAAWKIAGAGLDVTDPEPLPADSPLWDMENVIITPHSSGFSEVTDRRRFECFSKLLEKFLAGEPLDYQVDFSRGY